MVRQYPHRIVFTITGNSYRNGQGNWVEGTPSIIEYPGRVEANSSGGFLTDEDGKRLEYSWTLYMPLPAQDVPAGCDVEVFSGADKICKSKLKRFNIGQLNARAWL